MKGILLVGGGDSRLRPMTQVVSKQLLSIYDKPMIYYPLSTLMLAGIREVLVISTSRQAHQLEQLLANGKQWGLSFSYAAQPEPEDLLQALVVGRDFVGDDALCLILGDSIFFGDGFSGLLKKAAALTGGATIFGYPVTDLQNHDVIGFDSRGHANSLEAKPTHPKSNYAVTGLYFYDNRALDLARDVKRSSQGEREIIALNRQYLEKKELTVELLGRGYAWLETDTPDGLLQASQFVQVIEARQGLKIACPEEIAWRQGYISLDQLEKLATSFRGSSYGQYLSQVARDASEIPARV